MTLADKVILITGASSGIGAALAREVSQQGARVVLAARNEAALKTVAADCPGSLVVPTDITDRDACQRMIEKTVEHFGRLDILVNNAGLSMLSRFDEIEDFAVFERLMEVNYFGAVYCTHAALPHLKKTGGLVVGISTLAGKTGVPLRTGYSASKHALQGFLDSLRIELMGSGVDVSIISPGFVDTEIRQHSLGADGRPLERNPLHGRRMMSAEAAAHIIAQAIDKRKREVLMGTQGKLLSIGRLLVPGFVDRMAYRSAYKK
jgi:NAD(P)-dependent dehydrogenase (short-subunit alcohol dehydrogenase family)